MAQKKTNVNIIAIWFGILVPIVAALIPYALNYVQPESGLTYNLVGPVSVNGVHAINLSIRNEGKKLEKNVRVWLKERTRYIEEGKQKKPEQLLKIETTVPYKIGKEADNFVISLGDLRPDEKIELSILSEVVFIVAYGKHVNGVSIKSDEHLATIDAPSDLEKIFYPIGFWGFIVLMVLIFVIGIYQEHMKNVGSARKASAKKSGGK
jgi:hypothetical protein